MVLIIILIASLIYNTLALQCVNDNDEPVDWFVAYKLPKDRHNGNPLIQQGMFYMYITSNNGNWTQSNMGINDTQSMISKSISGIYTDNFHILYNDQPPQGESQESKGHTKGVVLASSKGGLWLIHSVPHFPFSLKSYSYPATGVHYGQSFLCISLDLERLDRVGLQLQYNEPQIFSKNLPDTLHSLLPHLFDAANSKTVSTFPYYHVSNLTSMGQTQFLSFAKSKRFMKDLYADLVGPQLRSNLFVESWPNEPHRLPSECGKEFEVDNVLSISIPNPSYTFSSTKDHSKWSVSTVKDAKKWICIGDINRAEKQTMRGGGTTCLQNEALAKKYLELVASTEKCRRWSYLYVIV